MVNLVHGGRIPDDGGVIVRPVRHRVRLLRAKPGAKRPVHQIVPDAAVRNVTLTGRLAPAGSSSGGSPTRRL
jgi:hypothetical protein